MKEKNHFLLMFLSCFCYSMIRSTDIKNINASLVFTTNQTISGDIVQYNTEGYFNQEAAVSKTPEFIHEKNASVSGEVQTTVTSDIVSGSVMINLFTGKPSSPSPEGKIDTLTSPVTNGKFKFNFTTPDPLRSDTHPLIEVVNHTIPNVRENDKYSLDSIEGLKSTQATSPLHDRVIAFNKMSWLDAFMFHHRGTVWVIVNSFFMVVWVVIGVFSLYRLLGLPWCSPYLSKTQFLLVHLLIFTASTFEFVQLIHLSYGSYEGLPLFLTLLLTHTPTPCLAVSLIIMIYSVIVTSGLPVLGACFPPPQVFLSVLAFFIIGLSFFGDIVIGITKTNLFLILIRAFLNGLCLIIFLTYIFTYSSIAALALKLNRESRADLRTIPLPLDVTVVEGNTISCKDHLKRMLSDWAKFILFSSIVGSVMCASSFCMSLFFTVSYVPLWGFWTLHSCLFTSQVILVIFITYGASLSLNYNSPHSYIIKYFFPSRFRKRTSQQAPFIKRGNCLYQRVSIAGGPSLSQIASQSAIDDLIDGSIRNNVNMTPNSYGRSRVNLKRSATFTCPTPYEYLGSKHFPIGSNPHIYPVLSDHLLPHGNTFKPNVNEFQGNSCRANRGINYSQSFNYGGAVRKKDIRPISQYHRPYSGGTKHFNGESSVICLPKSIQENALSPIAFDQSLPYADAPEVLTVVEECRQPNIMCNSEASCSPLAAHNNSIEYSYTSKIPHESYCPPSMVYSYPLDTMNSTNDLHNTPKEYFMARVSPHSNFHNFSNVSSNSNVRTAPKKPVRCEPILVKDVVEQKAFGNSSHLSYTSPNFSVKVKESGVNALEIWGSPNVNGCDAGLVKTKENPPPEDSFKLNGNSDECFIQTQYKSLENGRQAQRDSNTTGKGNSNKKSPFRSLASTSEVDEDEGEYKSLHDPLLETSSIRTDFTVDSESVVPCTKTNSSFDSESGISGASCTRQLRRNHSTAGDFRNGLENHRAGKSLLNGVSDTKYPWYGTWGGRKKGRKKKSEINEAQKLESGFDLQPLSSSRSSLSSLYGKIRNKKSRSLYCQPSSTIDTPTDEISGQGVEDFSERREDASDNNGNEIFSDLLPNISEDIDLASEILSESETLYNFYSLKRSDIKKKKAEKLKISENEKSNVAPHDISNGSNIETEVILNGNHGNQVTENGVEFT